jgi:ClpP class serine protease
LQLRGLLECQLLTQVIEASNNLFRDDFSFNVKETRKITRDDIKEESTKEPWTFLDGKKVQMKDWKVM